MSDAARKDFSTKASETLTPDSQKSTLDKAGETATDLGDKAASMVQPGDSKSTTQKLGDSAESNTGEKSYLQQAQEGAQQVLDSAGQTLSNLTGSGEKK